MSALRNKPKGLGPKRFVAVPFSLGLLVFGITPSPLGFQDLGALIANQPSVAERGRQHVLTAPFSATQASVFNFPRPIGTAMPDPAQFRSTQYQLASLSGA